jgi:hypothetical protein
MSRHKVFRGICGFFVAGAPRAGRALEVGWARVAPFVDSLAPSENGFEICRACRRLIDPAAHDTLRAVEFVRVDGLRSRRYRESGEVVFHAACFRATSARYRLISSVT